MTGTRFSVILISYNQEEYIDDAIRSLTSSTFRNFELICVDDGSSDRTAAKLQEIALSDARVRLITIPHSGKPAVARNAGLMQATGEYVCFLDGDDIADAERLAYFDQTITACRGSADVVFGDYMDFANGVSPELGTRCIGGTPHEDALRQMTVGDSLLASPSTVEVRTDRLLAWLVSVAFILNTRSVCIRRDIIAHRKLQFPIDRRIGEDNLFWLKCLVGSQTIYVNRVVAYWRKHSGSLTAHRTPATQRELVMSMWEELRTVSEALSGADKQQALQRIYLEEFEVGWLLESEGAWRPAMAEYLRLALRFRRAVPLLAAAKAPLRHLMRAQRTYA